MNSKEIPISNLLTCQFDDVFNESNCYGFYDWFCETKSLKNKAKTLFSRLKGILRTKTTKFDPAKCYVFFKNNCPCVGKLYDDLRICDLETGDVLYTVVPSNGRGEAELWGIDNDFEKPLTRGDWSLDVLDWFAIM